MRQPTSATTLLGDSVPLLHKKAGLHQDANAIVWWWESEKRPHFPDERKLLIVCDAGGSNGYRLRLWKQQLQDQLADRLGIEVMICHYPTGSS